MRLLIPAVAISIRFSRQRQQYEAATLGRDILPAGDHQRHYDVPSARLEDERQHDEALRLGSVAAASSICAISSR